MSMIASRFTLLDEAVTVRQEASDSYYGEFSRHG